MVRCTGAYLGLARSQHHRLVLAPVAPRVLARVIYRKYASIRHYHKYNA
jgi:hypothetical protein